MSTLTTYTLGSVAVVMTAKILSGVLIIGLLTFTSWNWRKAATDKEEGPPA